jgi:hypothetical protein
MHISLRSVATSASSGWDRRGCIPMPAVSFGAGLTVRSRLAVGLGYGPLVAGTLADPPDEGDETAVM